MSECLQVISITSNITLNDQISSVLLCQHTIPIIITLPPSLCDGIFYQINRSDDIIANTVTLDAGTQVIITSTASSSSTLLLEVRTYTEIVSQNGNWSILKRVNIEPRSLFGIYSTTFVSNNSQPYLILGSTNIAIAMFPYYSTLYQLPSIFSVCVTHISGTVTGEFRITDVSNTVRSTILISITSGTNIFSSTVSGFPPADTILTVRWVSTSGANNKLGINFVFIS